MDWLWGRGARTGCFDWCVILRLLCMLCVLGLIRLRCLLVCMRVV